MKVPKIVLSPDQEAAFAYMKAMDSDDKRMMFLTGNAGTGKSMLINMICKEEHTIKLAPTAIAAQNISGRTLHSFFKIKPGYYTVSPNAIGDIITKMAPARFIIIDEISMVSEKMFDLLVTTIRLYAPHINIILTGDFHQLPPVEGRLCKYSIYWDQVIEHNLTQIHRQSDAEFIGALDDIRNRKMFSVKVKSLMEDCMIKPGEDFPENVTILSPYRKVVHEFNRSSLESLGAEIITAKATITEGEWKENKIPEVIDYAIGARVLMLTNDYIGGWVNGSTGKIISITESGIITIQTDRGRMIAVAREYHEIVDSDDKVLLGFYQYPFQLGYAITIHKSQGMTMDRVVIDMSNTHFARGMTYVAFSRCRTKEGLYII